MFRTPHTVRFADVDFARVVYYPRYFHAFHVAFEEFWSREAGRPYSVVVAEDRIGFPTVHIESDFKKAVTYGDPVDILVGVKRFGNRSIVFRYEVENRETGETCATADITKAVVDIETFKTCALPQHLREALDTIAIPG